MLRRTMSTRISCRLRAGRGAAVALAGTLATGSLLVVGGATTAASAAEIPTWERLAGCESGNNWHINTGNGYYGGLQFSDPTWDAYKGPRMAERADRASKKAQIITGERTLDAQGWGAWPACSEKLGLGPADAKGKPYGGKG